MDSAMMAAGGTALSILLSMVVWFITQLIGDNKDAHKSFSNNIKELNMDLDKIRQDLIRLGLVSSDKDTGRPTKHGEELESKIKKVHAKLNVVKSDVDNVKKAVSPEAVDGLVLYESIPEYLSKLAKFRTEQENLNPQILRVLKKHNETLVKLKESQAALRATINQAKKEEDIV
jgi:chromosome segregation ATPase